MRDILFRGKRRDNDCWETGSLVIVREGISGEQVSIADKMTGYHTPVFSETVGQYTGLTDKNGKKIFEGDIFRELDGGMNNIPRMVCWDERHLKWKCPLVKKHWAYGYNDCSLWMIHGENVEIIGNIRDNPELLGGADNG